MPDAITNLQRFHTHDTYAHWRYKHAEGAHSVVVDRAPYRTWIATAHYHSDLGWTLEWRKCYYQPEPYTDSVKTSLRGSFLPLY